MTLGRRLAGADAARRVVEQLDDGALLALLSESERGWGWTQRCVVARQPLFVKAIPVTDREREAGLPTTNLYGIPPYLNYPFGSPGIGIGRELAFARRSTAWVADGVHAGFPILVHDRLIERRAGGLSTELATDGGFSAYRLDDDGMNQYLADRRAASWLLILVYEAFQFTAVDRLTTHPAELATVVDDVGATARFLRSQGVVHFDIDMFNIVTDGESAHVSDHGLVLDSQFDLNDAERRFLDANRHFDEGSLLMAVGHQLLWNHRALPAEQRALLDAQLGLAGLSFDDAVTSLLDAVENGALSVDPLLRSMVDWYRPVIAHMHGFAQNAKRAWHAATQLDDARLAELIDSCGSARAD